jgi:hypothetical protein
VFGFKTEGVAVRLVFVASA